MKSDNNCLMKFVSYARSVKKLQARPANANVQP